MLQDQMAYQVSLVNLVTEVFLVKRVPLEFVAMPDCLALQGRWGQKVLQVAREPLGLVDKPELPELKETPGWLGTEECPVIEVFKVLQDNLDHQDLWDQ